MAKTRPHRHAKIGGTTYSVVIFAGILEQTREPPIHYIGNVERPIEQGVNNSAIFVCRVRV